MEIARPARNPIDCALALAGATRAHAQAIDITNPMSLTAGTTTNVGPGTVVLTNPTLDVFVAPTLSGTAGTTPGQPQAILNIMGATISTGPASGPPIDMTSTGLVVNGGGTTSAGAGLTTNNQSNTAIKATVTDSNLSSTGHGVVWLVGPNAMLTANGGTWTGSGTPTNFQPPAVPGDAPNIFPGLGAQEATVVTVQNGASADLSNMTLDLFGPDGFLPASKMALCVGGCGVTGDLGRNVGGTATLDDVAITVTSGNSAGIWVSRISNVNVTDGSITVEGNNGQGVHADSSGSLTLTDNPIIMNGSNSLGVFAFTTNAVRNLGAGTPTGMVTIDGGSIMTTGPNSTGAMASGADANGVPATVVLNGTTIETTGENSNGLAACACGVVAGRASDTNPDFNSTVAAVPVGGAITATNTDITTMGLNSIGAFAQDGGSISLTDSTVKIMNNGGAGYFANGVGINGAASTISATNTIAETMGANSPGGTLSNGGKLTINGGSVTTTGAGSFGFLVTQVTPVPFVKNTNLGNPGVSAGNPLAANTLTIENAMVTSAADAFHVTGAAAPGATPGATPGVLANIDVSGSTITGGPTGDQILLNTLSSGLTNLTATNSTLTGAILTDASSTAHVTLNGGSWNMSLSSNMTTLAENGSTINFAQPALGAVLTNLDSYKTLTVNPSPTAASSAFTGNGGLITMNTFVGPDGSPSDRIVIENGAATLSTDPNPVSLHFRNTGGLGEGTGQGNGILVVQANEVGGTTEPGMFVKDNIVRPGALDYDLFRGGITGDPAVSNDWFLRASFVTPEPEEPGEPPGPEEPPVVPPGPPLPPVPPPTPLPPDVEFPIIGPELATYGVVQPLARELGLSILGTLNDRVGDTYEPDVLAPAVPPAPEGPAVELPTKKGALPTKKPGPTLAPRPLFSPSVWGRFFGQAIDNHYQAFADPRASGNLWGFQGGIDLLRGPVIPGGFDRAGLYGAYGNVNSNVTGLETNPAATAYVLTRTGSMSLDAWSAGGYWTHVGPGGWYLDAVLQGTWYSGSASTVDARLNTDGTGFIASLEGGVPFAFPQLGPGFVLEPQGQILWQKVSFRQDYDGLGQVGLGDTTGPTGRVGLRGKWTIVTADGQIWQPYVRANLWQNWGADANTTFGTEAVPLVTRASLLDLGGGLTGRINTNVSVFGNVGYAFQVGAANGVRQNGVFGSIGARYTW